jgi:hypothetical protein
MANFTHDLIMSRPINATGDRIIPSDLWMHRSTHHFRAPCCLCPLKDNIPSNSGSDFVEAEISQELQGQYGEYIAVCAKQACGYQGMLNKADI